MRDFHHPGRSPVLATEGMVATSHPLAARLAVDTLARGGTAADAAVAGAVLLGLCEPQMTGLGGDCFVLVKPAGSETVEALNGSGRAPAGADAAKLRGDGHDVVPVSGPHSVTMPGAVDAFCALLERHGSLGLDAVLGPVIPYFERGVPVAPRTAFDWTRAADTPQGSAREIYLSGGAAPSVGARFALPRQAEVLRRIVAEGRAGFYAGEVAEDMVAALRAAGGSHTLEDFAAVACDWGTPIAGDYRGTELIEHAPNGQGAAAILMANILKRFDLGSMDPLGARRAHLEAEVAKLAYDARDRFVSDPASMTRLDHMLSQDTADRLADLIDPRRAMAGPAALSEQVHKDTIYITAVDRDGMAVSLIYSIFASFGSGLASDRFGILFHNRGSGFTLAEGHPNEMAPGRRPMHTIIPAMLAEGGRVTMPFGVMGGPYQACGHARVLSNLVDYGMDPQTALDAPRAFPEAGVLKVERGYSDAVRAELAELGHEVTVPETPIGGAQAIRIHASGVLEGASDPRKDGCALGY
jgi:gamma-glutamyltranspeptidase/glutathione hydrolase